MYCLIPEKQLRLVYETFYLTIGVAFFTNSSMINAEVFGTLKTNYKIY